ncbi:hypothetical protein H9P43_007765 [Blastocladiella emersonii ATCC 22665]|nr:hypothetical protein H9P43_007765 [Blastocladiella emersonii ATCC 22665]
MLREFTITEDTLRGLLAELPNANGQAYDVACDWLRDHGAVWEPWIGAPLADHVVPIRTNSSSDLDAILIICIASLMAVLAVAVLGATWRSRNQPSLRVQSPALLALQIVGALVFALRLAVPAVTGASSGAPCIVRAWLMSLGLVTIQFATAARLWHVYAIIANVSWSVTVVHFGRLTTVRGTTNRQLVVAFVFFAMLCAASLAPLTVTIAPSGAAMILLDMSPAALQHVHLWVVPALTTTLTMILHTAALPVALVVLTVTSAPTRLVRKLPSTQEEPEVVVEPMPGAMDTDVSEEQQPELPTDLPPRNIFGTNRSSTFGTIRRRADDVPKPGAITIMLNADDTSSVSNVTNFIGAILARDILGLDVRVVERDAPFGIYTRLVSGQVSAALEIWPVNKVKLYLQYVTIARTVHDMGQTGYTGVTMWSFPATISAQHPGMIFESWRSLLQPETLELLPLAGSTPPARLADGTFVCTVSWCANGVYTPPQCQPGGTWAGRCREMWHMNPGVNPGESEQMIHDLGLPIVVVYLGASYDSRVTACLAAASPTQTCLIFGWTPFAATANFGLLRVNLPSYTTACWSGFNMQFAGTSSTRLDCAWPVELLQKLAGPTVMDAVPQLAAMIRAFTITESTLQGLLSPLTSDNDRTFDVACEWVRDHAAVWSPWIAAPPADHVVPFRRTSWSDLDISLITFVSVSAAVLAALVLAAIWRYRKEPSLRVQSPALLSLQQDSDVASKPAPGPNDPLSSLSPSAAYPSHVRMSVFGSLLSSKFNTVQRRTAGPVEPGVITMMLDADETASVWVAADPAESTPSAATHPSKDIGGGDSLSQQPSRLKARSVRVRRGDRTLYEIEFDSAQQAQQWVAAATELVTVAGAE